MATGKSNSLFDLLPHIPSIVALAGAYGLAASIIHQLSYLVFSGDGWAARFLTLSDYLGNAVGPAVVSVFVTILVLAVYRIFMHREEGTPAHYFGTAFFLLAAFSMLLWLARFRDIAICLAVMAIFVGVVALTARYLKGDRRNLVLILLALALPIVCSASLGAFRGIPAHDCMRAATLELDERNAVPIEGRVVLIGERGVAIEEIKGDKISPSLIPLDKIKRLTCLGAQAGTFCPIAATSPCSED